MLVEDSRLIRAKVIESLKKANEPALKNVTINWNYTTG
jgi:hypothetical protein